MLYHRHKNIVIPEVLLECGPSFEKNLRHDLEEIDSIANSGSVRKITEYVTLKYMLIDKFHSSSGCVEKRYGEAFDILFQNAFDGRVHNNLKDFLRGLKYPDVINRDVIKDLLPIGTNIMSGDRGIFSILDCIFRYILYAKTKHLLLFTQSQMKSAFDVCFFDSHGIDKATPDIIFNY